MRRSLIPPLLAVVFLSAACATKAPDTLKKIKDSGSLAIGYRESSVPFSFVDREKKPNGYSVESASGSPPRSSSSSACPIST